MTRTDRTIRAVMLSYIALMLVWAFGWGLFRLVFRDDYTGFIHYGNRGNSYMLDTSE